MFNSLIKSELNEFHKLYLLELLTNLDENVIYYIFVLVPLFNTGVCLYKILNNQKCL